MRVISGSARGTKLESIDSLSTRPTLDRVKESLFNILQNKIEDSVILDLFAGSGAIGIEFLSRGCKKAIFCDNSSESIKMIQKNLTKTRLIDKAIIINTDYGDCLDKMSRGNQKFDIIFIDPPYKADIAIDSVEKILKYKLLNPEGIIIIETDEKQREIESLKQLNVEIFDIRKYGRANLIFLVERG